MHSDLLNQIEETIDHLSYKEQLWLIEQLAHRLREGLIKSDISKQSTFKSQLVVMAEDSEIQSELRKIEHEFSTTEIDGLEFE